MPLKALLLQAIQDGFDHSVILQTWFDQNPLLIPGSGPPESGQKRDRYDHNKASQGKQQNFVEPYPSELTRRSLLDVPYTAHTNYFAFFTAQQVDGQWYSQAGQCP